MDSIETVPKDVEKIYLAYMALHTPYYISHAEKTLKPRIYKGKGTPDEIKDALKRLQKGAKKGQSEKEILKEHQIGIDCSGFISHLYNSYTTETTGKHIWSFYARKTMNPLNWIMFKIQPIVSMLNANTLTSSLNAIRVAKVKDTKPMDLIRFSGGKHVAMIYAVHKKDGIVTEIEYIHATDGIGVTKGIVHIADENKSIIDQEWEKGEEGIVNEPGKLIRYKINDNGIRRPIFLTH